MSLLRPLLRTPFRLPWGASNYIPARFKSSLLDIPVATDLPDIDVWFLFHSSPFKYFMLVAALQTRNSSYQTSKAPNPVERPRLWTVIRWYNHLEISRCSSLVFLDRPYVVDPMVRLVWLGCPAYQTMYVLSSCYVVHIRRYLLNPDGPLSLDPSSTVLHYAQTIFEGTKAYRKADGTILLFRPDMNMKRMNTSARRIALPVRFHFSNSWCLSRSRLEFQRRCSLGVDQTTCPTRSTLDT